MSTCEFLLLSGSKFESAIPRAGVKTVGHIDSMATGLPSLTPVLTD